jgi:predicted transcriptional regulator
MMVSPRLTLACLTGAQRRALLAFYAYGKVSAKTPTIVRADTLHWLKRRGLIVYEAEHIEYRLTDKGEMVVSMFVTALLAMRQQYLQKEDYETID